MDAKSAFSCGRARRAFLSRFPQKSQLDGVLANWWDHCTRCSTDLATLSLMSDEIVGMQRITSCPMHVPSRDKKDAEMSARFYDLFVVGCLKDVQEVYHGLAGAFVMSCTFAGPRTGNSEVEYSRKTGWKFTEIPSMRPFCSKRLEWTCASL